MRQPERKNHPESRAAVVVLTAFVVLIASGAAQGQTTAKDPFGEDTASEEAAHGTVDAGDVVEKIKELSGCPPLSQKLCGKANVSLLLMCGGYVIVCLFLGLLAYFLWSKRGTGSAGLRFLVPMLVFSAAAGTLVGLDPLRPQNLACCLADGTFRTVLFLGDSAPARALVLGVLPLAVLFVIIVITANALHRRRAGGG
ncbi:MAG: hypothetical protein ABIJ56_13720 [Pseudomonadota bacterium]